MARGGGHKGPGLLEYGLIALIVIVSFVALFYLFGPAYANILSGVLGH